MSELQSRFCWRCLFFALVPLVGLVAVAWAAMSSASAERASVAESTGGMVEQLADLDAANAELRRELATTREALQAARGAALAGGDGAIEDLASRIAALPERERLALLDQTGATSIGPDELIDRLARMPEGAQSRVFEALPALPGFQNWYEGIGKDEQREWLGRLPGGAQPIRLQNTLPDGALREARLTNGAGVCDCVVEAKSPDALLQSVQLLTPSERAVFFPALAEREAMGQWFGAATPGERVEFVNALPNIEQVDIRVQSNQPMAPISLAEALEREAALTARLEASDMALRAAKARAGGGGEAGDESMDALQKALSRAEVARDEAMARSRETRSELLRVQRDLQAAARARAANESALREARAAVARIEGEKNLAATAIAQLETQIRSLNEERARLANALENAAPSDGPTRLAQVNSTADGDVRAKLSEAYSELNQLRAENTRLIARSNALEGSVADATDTLRRQRDATAAAREERDAALTRAEDAEKALRDARADWEKLRSQLDARVAQLEQSAGNDAEITTLREKVAQLEGALKAAEAAAEAQRRSAASELDRLRGEISSLERALAAAKTAAASAATGDAEAKALREDVARLEGAVKAAETAAEAQRRSAAAELDRARAEIDRLGAQLAQTREAADGAADAKTLEAEIARLEGALKAAQTAAEAQRRAASAAQTAFEREKAELASEIEALRRRASAPASDDAGKIVDALEAQIAEIREVNARLLDNIEAIAKERDAIIDQASAKARRSELRIADLETEVVRLTAEIDQIEKDAPAAGASPDLGRLQRENAGLVAANRRLEDERNGAREAAKERESALNDQIEAMRAANRELSRKLSEASVKLAGVAATEGDDGAAGRVLLRQLEADKAGLVAQVERVEQQLEGLREASAVREEALKSRITAATRARQAMQVERDTAIDAARRLANRAPSDNDGASPDESGADMAAMQAERDAAVALALRLQGEVERGVQTLMIEGRGAMTAEAVESTIRALEQDIARLRSGLDAARRAPRGGDGANQEALVEALERADRAETALARARQGLDALALAEQERDAEKERAEAALKRARDGLDALAAAKREQDAALERATRAEAALDRARDGLDRLAKAETERDAALERAERAETALDRARSGLDSLSAAQRERDEAVARAERAVAELNAVREQLAAARSSGDAPATAADGAALRQAQAARDVALAERDRAVRDLEAARERLGQATTEIAGLKADLEKSRAEFASAAAQGDREEDGVKLVDRPDLAIDGDVVVLRRQIASLEAALARVGDRDRAEAERRGEIVERLRVSMGATETASLALPLGPIVTPPLRLDGALVFEPGDATVSAKGKEKLAELAAELKRELAAYPDRPWRLAIEGHTDRRPISTPQFPSNWTLSAARAAAVAKVLEELGVPARRLLAIGRAEYDPVDPANTPEAYSANRRIEFDVVSH